MRSVSDDQERELSRNERAVIRRLVTERCANYDNTDHVCFPLDDSCYMLHKCWTGALCQYFSSAVLPTEPMLELALHHNAYLPEHKTCPVCGQTYPPVTSQAYCSDACRTSARRKAERERKRRTRQNKG